MLTLGAHKNKGILRNHKFHMKPYQFSIKDVKSIR